MDLQDKVVVITGASKGIGKALVLAALAKGAKVAGWSRSKPDISHVNFIWVKCDVGDEENVQKAYAHTLDFLGPADVLVNNAGFGKFSLLEEQSSEEWLQMFNVNVNGLFYCTKAVLPSMKQNRAGHIVNIASIAALDGIDGAAGYCGTKHAVRGISASLYKEVKKHNIKVTCVYPGSVDTEFFNGIDGITANPTMLHTEDVATMIIQALETPDNYNTLNIEVRPMNPRYS